MSSAADYRPIVLPSLRLIQRLLAAREALDRAARAKPGKPA